MRSTLTVCLLSHTSLARVDFRNGLYNKARHVEAHDEENVQESFLQ